jgi:hypothetical protein
MKSILTHLSIITFSIVLCSCDSNNKQEETVCSAANTVLVPQDLKDRFFFKVGTYWIYKNLQTNETDSIWVFNSTNNTSPVDRKIFGDGYNKCYQVFDLKTKSIKFSSAYYYTRLGISLHPPNVMNTNNELFGIGEGTPLNNYTAIYRIEIRGNKYENQDGAEILMLDSLTTGTNIVFKDILRLKYPAGFQTQDYMDDMHYAKNIGLVKFHRFTDNTNWELIRYNIIQ